MSADWRDGVAEFFGQDANSSVRSGRPNGPGMQAPKATVWDAIWGRSQQELDDASRTFRNDQNRNNFQGRIEALGGTFIPGQTSGQYQQQIVELQDERTDERYPKTPEGRAFIESTRRFDENTRQTNKRLEAQIQLQTQSMNNQNAALIAQMKDTADQRSFDREQSSADRQLTLQLANINADLQDKRLAYDKETRRLDRRDRNIATLMSGLGQLGGAFSI